MVPCRDVARLGISFLGMECLCFRSASDVEMFDEIFNPNWDEIGLQAMFDSISTKEEDRYEVVLAIIQRMRKIRQDPQGHLMYTIFFATSQLDDTRLISAIIDRLTNKTMSDSLNMVVDGAISYHNIPALELLAERTDFLSLYQSLATYLQFPVVYGLKTTIFSIEVMRRWFPSEAVQNMVSHMLIASNLNEDRASAELYLAIPELSEDTIINWLVDLVARNLRGAGPLKINDIPRARQCLDLVWKLIDLIKDDNLDTISSHILTVGSSSFRKVIKDYSVRYRLLEYCLTKRAKRLLEDLLKDT